MNYAIFSASLAACTLALSATVTAQAEPATNTESQEATASDTAAPALWKVADEDTTIYLFGTIHALPTDIEWSTPTLENALAASDSIVTEIKMGPGIEQEMQGLVMSKGILPQGTTLRSLLSEEQTASYEEAMGKLSIPAAAFDQFEPWYAGMMMSMLPLLQQGYSCLLYTSPSPRDA